MGFEFRVLKERRQWALSSVSGPPCFGLCSCFARFFKNHNRKKKKKGLFIGKMAACFFLSLLRASCRFARLSPRIRNEISLSSKLANFRFWGSGW